ncbi:MAG TPA: redox-sensing transcriptional repressor Rex [Thermoanaerobaculia bacterium]|jgi:redox-sensing transcriptional repressor|nr:redox-sensing transcriptional repressor Rex [Thermoanaerobaculia bacterium]
MAPRANGNEAISEMTTGRLSVYLRCLTYLESANKLTVSSAELADRFHLNSAQIRKDLACFGEFGTRGVGYKVADLKDALIHELGLDRTRKVLIIGAGNLGMALADYRGFNERGFHIVGMVDIDPEKFGRRSRSGVPVLPYDQMPQIVRRNNVEIGILAVSTESAQEAYDALIDTGVRAILNFAPVQMRYQRGVKVRSVDLRINLESLSFYLKNVEDGTAME